MSNRYDISIAIPAYGLPEAVCKNVHYLLNNTDENVEIVVVDNDYTGEQIKEYMTNIKEPRFSYIQNETNIGRIKNMVKAVEVSSSDNVFLCSCDDTIYTEKLPIIIRTIRDNPEYGIIMGRVPTDLGNSGFRPIKPGHYTMGFEAMYAIPLMYSLRPFVVNKRHLNLEWLMNSGYRYMQNAILWSAVAKGDLFFLDCDIALGIDERSDVVNNFRSEIISKNLDFKSWDIAEITFAPEVRASQFISYIRLFERANLRMDNFIKLIDQNVNYAMGDVVEAVYASHDPICRGAGLFMDSDYVLDRFEEEVCKFLSLREEEAVFFYSGRLHDRILNEKNIIRQASDILLKINECNNSVYIYGTGKSTITLKRVLELIGVQIKGVISDEDSEKTKCDGVDIIPLSEIEKCGLILVNDIFREKIDERLKGVGLNNVEYFDLMNKYLAIAWCNKHKGEDSMRPFCAYA